MDASAKRKNPPGGGSQRHVKKSKGSSAGKYVTPHHKAKLEALKAKGRRLDVGDVGFWVTCQRTQESKALEEIISICDEYGEKLYGITPQPAPGEGEDEEDVDIEAAIQKEVEAMKQSKTPDTSVFAPLRLPLDCLIFVKAKPPVEPRQFVRRIVDDAKLVSDRTQRRSRFINRLTPITLMGRATEAGIDELAKEVLAPEFQLVGAEAGTGSETTEDKDMGASYCIRLSSRAHSTLKREDIIKQVAGLVGPRHKVNLTSPDKVIIIEIFQTFCGMSVVDGDWDSLKRYNIRELYEAATRNADEAKKAEQAADKPRTEEPEAEAADTAAEAKAEETPEQPRDAAAAATA